MNTPDSPGLAVVVGKPYIEGKTKYAAGADYNFRSGVHELRHYTPRLTKKDAESFRTGKFRVGLFLRAFPAIFLLYKIEGYCVWSDCSFSAHLVPEAERTPPQILSPGDPNQYAILGNILVNADNGLVAAMRLVTMSPVFTSALHKAILRQLETPFDPVAHDKRIAEVYAAYPDSKKMVPDCELTEVLGLTLPGQSR